MSTAEKSEQHVSASDLAKRLKADPRVLRKWLRAEGMGLGQRGKRYSFSPQEAGQIARKWKPAHKDAA